MVAWLIVQSTKTPFSVSENEAVESCFHESRNLKTLLGYVVRCWLSSMSVIYLVIEFLGVYLI